MKDDHAEGRVDHAIIVACHAVYRGDLDRDPLDAHYWSLFDYQRGEAGLYMEHIRAGVMLASDSTDALLVFSGGQTRLSAGPFAEAAGYWTAAAAMNWWGTDDVRQRAHTEEYARDSFENILFSICRFKEITGMFPLRLSVISWGFKSRRFEYHRKTLDFPAAGFNYIGVNDPGDLTTALRGEEKVLAEFERDPYGVAASGTGVGSLATKRRQRNPFNRAHPYAGSCPELAGLFEYRGVTPFTDPLPWRR
ncbi:hypothetical protein JW905_01810 [bacterium]|nr:hypothetical protein [candidate division CSSED10-310 bacterium]